MKYQTTSNFEIKDYQMGFQKDWDYCLEIRNSFFLMTATVTILLNKNEYFISSG